MTYDPTDTADNGAEAGTAKVKKARYNKKALLADVVEATGVSRRDTQKVVDATLAAIAAALAEDKDVSAPALGTLRPGKVRENDRSTVTVVRHVVKKDVDAAASSDEVESNP